MSVINHRSFGELAFTTFSLALMQKHKSSKKTKQLPNRFGTGLAISQHMCQVASLHIIVSTCIDFGVLFAIYKRYNSEKSLNELNNKTRSKLSQPCRKLSYYVQYQRWSRGHKTRGQGQGHKKIRGQGQPFRGQALSRPRPRTKDTAANVLQKKKSSKKFFRLPPICRRTQNF